ncbi:MAG TPA: M20/M25/M40 family metallo-hydrolase [Bryobacteraceae bacterium]|nr:M20/M25/M40 family metallo-hydrolase [Bryobacteraceae bacterium]
MLAPHGDTVGVEREKWSVDPFAGLVKNGYVYGRGAIDFKGGIAVFTQAVMELGEHKVPLKRDIILLIEADEEGGQYNTSWLADSNWSKIDCEFALNEGGWTMKRPDGKVRYVSISTADKSSVTLVVTAHGTSTHSSMPRPDNAIFRLANALEKISRYDTKPELTDSTKQFYLTLAKTSEPPMSTYFYNLARSKHPALVKQADDEISKNVLLHAIMRNTIASVFLQAGFRGNVIPGSAVAPLNFRTVPGTKPEELIAEIKQVINDPQVDVGQPPANAGGAMLAKYMKLMQGIEESPPSTKLYQAQEKNADSLWSAPVTTTCFKPELMLSPDGATVFLCTVCTLTQSRTTILHECMATTRRCRWSPWKKERSGFITR